MELNNETWHIVNSIPKVTGFVGGDGGVQPTPMTEEEVQRITDAYLTAHHDIGMMLEPDSTVFKGNEIFFLVFKVLMNKVLLSHRLLIWHLFGSHL